VTEPIHDPTKSGTDIVESPATTLRRSSFLQVLLVLAAAVVVLAGMHLSAPILNPILFALVLSLLFSPVYAWVRRRGVPTPLALVAMLVGLTILIVSLFVILTVSIGKFTGRVGSYTTQLNGQLGNLDTALERLGLENVDLASVVDSSMLVGALGGVLSGIAGFLSDLFLILMIVLFLLGEGPAMMNRLRGATSRDNPRVERLAIIGRSVVRQFGLRAISQPRDGRRCHHSFPTLGG
jgi:AI-2 transport protein TqsA